MVNVKNITHIILDIDGTLTNGSIIYDSFGAESKAFSVKDGLVLKVLPKIGISVIFLTGRTSSIVEKRGRELGVMDILQGVSDKKAKLNELDINFAECLYIGDDLNDYAVMNMCGFKACPENAAREIKDICDYVSPYNGGHGAVRDILEYILKKKGKWIEVLKMFNIQ